MYIVMLGGPGAGKGTASAELAKDLGMLHISTGDIFREAIKNKTELGMKVQSFMDQGILVPDDIVNDIVKERLREPDCKNGVILDGFPRNKKQAVVLDEFMKENKIDQNAIIELYVSDEDIIKRITGRRTCSNKECGAIYNIITRPPQVENICDVCGSELKIRKDDNPETVRIRLEEYHKNSKDLLEYYRNESRLKTISPDIYDEKSLEYIIREIKSYIGK